ncbi:uncharacterized protein LOC125492557 isoform X2 [Beta vulgaris subsp. vulgaris]|uniref:uncharacterized protein LOC125492557 isoform X2 n=1 Tax=Beta vulgaris subsp. vulgaris TaxID=3555 RepID=UPI0020367AE1|nr:uncharacterized protein LOC125492557 isoform X2 [Beta vulgaris subsp. vulgaris]
METFVYASVPSLVEHLSGGRRRFLVNAYFPCFLQTKSFPAQLSKLTLELSMGDDKDLNIPSFPNVKHLELRAVFTFHGNLLPLMGFAEACLLLHDLKLEIYWISSSCLNVASDSESGSEYESDLVRRTHQMQSQKQNQIQSLT